MPTIYDLPIPILARIFYLLAKSSRYDGLPHHYELFRAQCVSKRFILALDWLFKGPLWPKLAKVIEDMGWEGYEEEYLYALSTKYIGGTMCYIKANIMLNINCPPTFRPIISKDDAINGIYDELKDDLYQEEYILKKLDQYIRYFIHWGDKEALEALFAHKMFHANIALIYWPAFVALKCAVEGKMGYKGQDINKALNLIFSDYPRYMAGSQLADTSDMSAETVQSVKYNIIHDPRLGVKVIYWYIDSKIPGQFVEWLMTNKGSFYIYPIQRQIKELKLKAIKTKMKKAGLLNIKEDSNKVELADIFADYT
jgi:hypothetical protein